MAVAPLPPALEHRLGALAARVRRLRIASGACWLVISALLSATAIVLLDAVFQLSVAARCVLQAGWFGFVGLLVCRFVAWSWQAEVSLQELARRIDARSPGLGDRLLAVAGPGADAVAAAGSSQLLATLARDADRRVRALDLAPVASARPVARLAGAGGAGILVVLVAAATVPGAGAELRRVGLPWYRPAVLVPFEVVVASGDPVVRRGDPVTLTAYLLPTEPGAGLPAAAVLVVRTGAGGPEQKFPMTEDGTAAFHATRPAVVADFEYRIEAAAGVSDWHTVRVADPVELTDQTTVEIIPPAYAAARAAKPTAGLTDLDGLQFSTAVFRLRFNRPAESAVVEWRPAGRLPTDPPVLIPVTLAPDRTGGTATFRLTTSGGLRVVLVTEPGVRRARTEVPIAVRVVIDAPPRFEQVAGVTTQSRTVRPAERVPVGLIAVDDVGVGAAELEYATGPDPGPTVRVPIPLTGAGTRQAAGQLLFDLAGKGRAGDTVRFRVRVTDTRTVADEHLGPQEAVYPPGGWAEFHLSDTAPALDRQEIFGQRDAVRNALGAVRTEITEAHAEAATLRADTAGLGPLPVDHADRLARVRERVQKAAVLLHTAAGDAGLTPALRPLAAAARAVADRPLRDAADSLGKATTDNAADRQVVLGTGLAHLTAAATQLEDLLRRNDRLAQDRLDRGRLAALAADQTAVADRMDTPPDDLLTAQRDLRDRLSRLLAESDPLKRGAAAAAGRMTTALAADATALATDFRDLAAATDQLAADLRWSLLDQLARTEAELAGRAVGSLVRIETAARLAGVVPPKAEDFRRVTDLLARDELVDALIELEKLAQALDHTAAEFDRWAAERQDPKAAARQLARWQDDLDSRFAAATGETPFDTLTGPVKAAFRAEQLAVLRAAERLNPPPDAGVMAVRDAAVVHLRVAVRRADADGAGAADAMKKAAGALAQLADKMPTLAERLSHTRPDLDKIRTDQDTIIAAAEQVFRSHERPPLTPAGMLALGQKLAPAAARQQTLAGRLARLDLPGAEPRQARAVAALKAAAADLKAGLPYDAVASLAWAKRELDRLRQATDNPPTVDDRADDLARRQAGVAAALGDRPSVKQRELLVVSQQGIAQEVALLTAPEAPTLLTDAQDAVRAAEAAFRTGSKPEETSRKARTAGAALAALAARLNGRESDRDRVDRLADNRRQAVCDARKLAGRPLNPDASGEARRQLAREVEELTHVRVGAAGQLAKKKVLDAYAHLHTKLQPDHQMADQKQIAAALDDLAGTMTDVAELTSPPAFGAGPLDPNPADAFLPSRSFADALRETARDQRAVRERAAGLGAEVTARLRPAEANPLAILAQRQHALAGAVADVTRALVDEKEPAAAAAGKAAAAARLAADQLAVGQVRSAWEAASRAAHQLRQIAADRANGKELAELAARQEAVVADLAGLPDDSAVAAAQQKAQLAALTTRAAELTRRFERAAKDALPGEPAGPALATATDFARRAETILADAAKKATAGMPADATRLRATAEKMLRQAAETLAGAGVAPSPTSPPLGPAELASGAAAREADVAMQRAVEGLGPAGDPAAARQAMRQAADALTRSAGAVGNGPPPGRAPE